MRMRVDLSFYLEVEVMIGSFVVLARADNIFPEFVETIKLKLLKLAILEQISNQELTMIYLLYLLVQVERLGQLLVILSVKLLQIASRLKKLMLFVKHMELRKLEEF